MINVQELNRYLISDYDAITEILEELGLTNIRPNYRKEELRCSREEGTNPSSVCVFANTLNYKCFSTGESGSIYNLVMTKLDKNFPQALEWVADVLGISTSKVSSNVKVNLPFGGFYKDLIHQNIYADTGLQTLDPNVLEDFSNNPNLMFYKDGISLETQEYFQIGYDLYSNRITVPQWDTEGNLVGVMGRLNDPDAPKESRWIPIIPCSRSLTVYGYHINRDNIQDKQVCIIGESEKFVMQLHSMGLYVGLATCGCNMSEAQIQHIKSLMCRTIILAYDEGVDESDLINYAERLKSDNFMYANKVGYIYDMKGDILPIGSKSAPSDYGREKLELLIKKYVKWI